MSGQSTSRYRKQRFPRPDRRRISTSYTSASPCEGLESDDDSSLNINKRVRHTVLPVNKPYRPPQKVDPKDHNLPACRLDKRARDEHNEQERSRRRELAVIYELIRCSFSNDDLRHLNPSNGPKSIDKLSYPQVLQIAHQLVCEEQHNLILFEKSLNDIKRIEKEFVRAGLPVPDRPSYPSIADNYRKVVQIVDNLLKHDKSARSPDGVYEITPAERAALGDQELSFLRPRSQRHANVNHHYSFDMEYSRGRKPLHIHSHYADGRDKSREYLNKSQYDSNGRCQLKRSSSTTSIECLDETDIPLYSLPRSPSSRQRLESGQTFPCYDDFADIKLEEDEDDVMINYPPEPFN